MIIILEECDIDNSIQIEDIIIKYRNLLYTANIFVSYNGKNLMIYKNRYGTVTSSDKEYFLNILNECKAEIRKEKIR